MNYNSDDAKNYLPEGDYIAILAECEETTSKSSGKEMLKCVWEILVGPRKVSIWDYIVNPTGLWRLREIAKALGRVGEFDLNQFQLAAEVGIRLQVTLSLEENPKYGPQNRIEAWAPVVGDHAPEQPMNAAFTGTPRHVPSDQDIPF